MQQQCYSIMAMDRQVRAAQNVPTVIHRVHQAHIRIQINHLIHKQKPILDIHHFHRLVHTCLFIHFTFSLSQIYSTFFYRSLKTIVKVSHHLINVFCDFFFAFSLQPIGLNFCHHHQSIHHHCH